MEAEVIAIIGRVVERIVIVIGGILAIRWAVSLLMKSGVGDSNVSYDGILGNIKITNAASGVVMALFGMIILGIGILNPLSITDPEKSGSHASRETHNAQSPGVKSDTLAAADTGKAPALVDMRPSKQPGQNEKDIRYSDPTAKVDCGPVINLQQLQVLYKLVFAVNSSENVQMEVKTQLLKLYEEIYNANKLSQAEEQEFNKLSTRNRLTELEIKRKKYLEGKLTSEFDYKRIQ